MQLPLFPLHTVLCPGIALPLHIFEERYRELVRHCLDTESPFGVVLIREGQEAGGGTISFSAIGTTAEIRKAGRYPDGRYDLLVVGTGRFAVEGVKVGDEPYIIAEATLLDDEVADPDEARRLANDATRKFVRYLELLQPREGESTEEIDISVEVETEEPDTETVGGEATIGEVEVEQGDETVRRKVVIPDDPTTLSYLLAGIIQIELPRRQALLEAETTDDRLRELLALIDRETMLLRRRLRAYVPTAAVLGRRGS
ncbi:MAG TPA: LON peptidase substrate-binding domain-containing protein [Candidatus Limnocylindrales bacterium]|nr:LON peptidase substrate-binding domain-containing protein [Candidatus Limnocylindrales bacterium]